MSTTEIVSASVPDALTATAPVVDPAGTPWAMKPLHITVDGAVVNDVVGYDVAAGYVVACKPASAWTADDVVLAKHTNSSPLVVVRGVVAVTLVP